MDNGQTTIMDLFDGRNIFNVPMYQRSYAWDEEQLEAFVDDFKYQDIKKDYFFGTILFQEKGRDGHFEIIDIVDGQQRITTLTIFMKLLIDRLRKKDEDIEILEETYIKYKGEYKLRIQPQDNDFFMSYIIEDNHLPREVVRTPSQRRLLTAKKYLNNQLDNFSHEVLLELKDKVERTKVLTYSVVDDAEATLIFETTNDRGKTLTNLEKTKSFLMYKTYLTSENPETILTTLQSRFSEIYRDFEKIEEFQIAEDAILQYHFIAFEQWKPSKSPKEYQRNVAQVKQKVNLIIKDQQLEQAADFIDKYSRELCETFAIMPPILLKPNSILTDIFAIGRPANFYPLLIKAYKLDDKKNKQNFCKVSKLVEIMSFRMYGIRRYRTNTAVESLYRLARDFKGDYRKLLSDLKNMLAGYCSKNDFTDSLLSPRFSKTVSGRDILYLFWKYENFLRNSKQPISPELSNKEFSETDTRKKLSIEHIVPQNPKKTKIVLDLNILPEMTEDFEENFLHSMGNLTFDPLSANASKRNSDFEIKNQKYFRRAPYKTQNELDTFLNPNTGKWDSYSIKKRAMKIVNFALDYWDYEKV